MVQLVQSALLDLAYPLGGMEGITSVETSLILKVPKFSYEWEIP